MKSCIIRIWGPCETADEVKKRMEGAENDIAVVFAPTKATANDMCYYFSNELYNNRNTSEYFELKPNYQLIDAFQHNFPIVARSAKAIRFFADDLHEEIKGIAHTDIKLSGDARENWRVYGANLRKLTDVNDDPSPFEPADLVCWVYSPNETVANEVVLQFAEMSGIYNSDSDICKVIVKEMGMPVVLWNPQYFLCEWTDGGLV